MLYLMVNNFMKYILLLIVLCFLLGSYSCKVPCTSYLAGISFNGFDSSDLASVIVKTYTKNKNFLNPTDSSIYSSSAFPYPYPYSADTFNLGVGTNTNGTILYSLSIAYDSDYEVDIPATGGIYKINGISFGDQTTTNTEEEFVCSLSCYVNGKPQSYASYMGTQGSGEGQAIVIEK